MENSETYAFNKLSAEISIEADKYAIDKLASINTPRPPNIDLYMMYYRLEYERLFSSRKQLYITDYNKLISTKYTNTKDLCPLCCIVEESSIPNYFNQKVSFCFHEVAFDPKCENCVLKFN